MRVHGNLEEQPEDGPVPAYNRRNRCRNDLVAHPFRSQELRWHFAAELNDERERSCNFRQIDSCNQPLAQGGRFLEAVASTMCITATIRPEKVKVEARSDDDEAAE